MKEKLLWDFPLEIAEEIVEKYHKKVIRRGEEECWGWGGLFDEKGYGIILLPKQGKYGHRYMRAPRVAFEFYKRPLEPGEVVRHRCDNRACTNPKHLLEGSLADNARDAIERRRNVFGERSWLAKISEKQAKEIRQRLGAREKSIEIARAVGCSFFTVRGIAQGRTWRYLGPIPNPEPEHRRF